MPQIHINLQKFIVILLSFVDPFGYHFRHLRRTPVHRRVIKMSNETVFSWCNVRVKECRFRASCVLLASCSTATRYLDPSLLVPAQVEVAPPTAVDKWPMA